MFFYYCSFSTWIFHYWFLHFFTFLALVLLTLLLSEGALWSSELLLDKISSSVVLLLTLKSSSSSSLEDLSLKLELSSIWLIWLGTDILWSFFHCTLFSLKSGFAFIKQNKCWIITFSVLKYVREVIYVKITTKFSKNFKLVSFSFLYWLFIQNAFSLTSLSNRL